MNDLTKNLRKKLLYRSLNRGCRETDILLGNFAKAEIGALPAQELPIYEQFLDEYDGDIYKWLTGQAEMPGEYKDNVGARIFNFCHSHRDRRHPAARPQDLLIDPAIKSQDDM